MNDRTKSQETMSSAIAQITNYHDWVFDSFKDFIKDGIALEIGSGHGIYSKKIAKQVQRLIVSDIDAEAIKTIQNQLQSINNIDYLVMDGINENQLPAKVDTIILVNVIEHIKNDRLLIDQCYNALNSSGRIVIFAPAFNLLFSNYDKQAGHYRRYTKSLCHDLLQDHFKIQKIRYFNKVGFFGWLLNKYSKSHINSKSTNTQIQLYDKMIPFLKYADYLIPFIGQSLIAVGTKRDTHEK